MSRIRRFLQRNKYTALYCAGWLGGVVSQASPTVRTASASALKVVMKTP